MRLLPALLLASFSTSAAQADVIISNLGEQLTSSTLFGSGASTIYKAFGFTMGSDDYTLEEVVLSITSTSTNPTPMVEIYSDGGGTPGMSLFVLDNPAVVTGTDDFIFTAGSPFVLSAGTSYWLYVTSVPMGGDPFNWESAGNTVLPSGPGATAINYEFNGGISSFYNRLEIRGSTDFGNEYCTPAAVNSTGQSGVISAVGSRFAADNDVTLQASSLPTNSFGFFITSQTQGFVMNPNGSAGNLCVLGAIGRYVGPGQIQNSGSSGMFSLVLDLTQTPQPTGLVSVMAGETWNFQAWHRDAIMGTPTSNFTSALEIGFL